MIKKIRYTKLFSLTLQMDPSKFKIFVENKIKLIETNVRGMQGCSMIKMQ